MAAGWTMKIEFDAESFPALKSIAEHILGLVADARSFKDLPKAGALSRGSGVNCCVHSYSVTYTCPVELRIEALREEIAELERSLASG